MLCKDQCDIQLSPHICLKRMDILRKMIKESFLQ